MARATRVKPNFLAGAQFNGIDLLVAGAYSTLVGNGTLTSIVVTHSLNTSKLIVGTQIASTGAGRFDDWIVTDVNSITFTFTVAPATNAIRVNVIGLV